MRNMIQSNTKAFSHLLSQLESGENYPIPSGQRYIATSPDEKDWLKHLIITEKINILPTVRACIVEYANTMYFVLIGLKTNQFVCDNTILESEPINAGLLTALLAEEFVDFNINFNTLEFYDNMVFQHQDTSYKGHDYTEFLDYLQPIEFFKIPLGSVLIKGDLNRILCFVFSANRQNIILNFESNLLETISELSLVGSDKIAYGLLLNSLLSTNYKHAFLELYRLIERLFPINYLKEFHSKVNTELTFLEFTATLETITSWRPKEDEAIDKIFLNSKPSTLENFNFFLQSSPSLSNFSPSSYFYKLRNSIVHYRAIHEEFKLSDNQWNQIIKSTLYLIDEHYSLNSKILD